MAFPSISFLDGKTIHCDSLPQISPCIRTGLACWNSSSNCFGLIYDIGDHIGGVIPAYVCTTSICPLGTYNQAWFNYIPSLPGNALYESLFALLLIAQIILAIRYKTWGFSLGMTVGLILEVTGYIGRIELHYNPFKKGGFLTYLVPLTIGPAFFSAAIYLCLSRIVILYGTRLSRFSPRTYTITFISCDVFSLVLQAIGGGMASTGTTQSKIHTGEHVMVAGLSCQVASLLLFMGLCIDFMLAVKKAGTAHSAHKICRTFSFKAFLFALGIATICIFIRSVFRVAELSNGFHGPLDNSEVTYMVLEGVMILIATISLTVFHPGFCLHGQWATTNFSVFGKKLPVSNDVQAGSTSEMDTVLK